MLLFGAWATVTFGFVPANADAEPTGLEAWAANKSLRGPSRVRLRTGTTTIARTSRCPPRAREASPASRSAACWRWRRGNPNPNVEHVPLREPEVAYVNYSHCEVSRLLTSTAVGALLKAIGMTPYRVVPNLSTK
jgi:hypothetical protein